MTPFATEFPVKPIPSSAAFVAQVVAWLRGSNYSTVLDDVGERDLDSEAPVVRSRSGEELRLRVFSRDGRDAAIGFRHDYPDSEGRLWRTETVVLRSAGRGGQDVIRLRTQCIAQRPGAHLETPRKPYLIKSVLRDGWGGLDGALSVSDQAIFLEDSQSDLALASSIIFGTATSQLPVVYFSASGTERWLLSKSQIERLAYELGGVAHVIVEPSRDFSLLLRDLTSSKNVYGGTVGVAAPDRGLIRRLYLGGHLADPRALHVALRDSVIAIRSNMPAIGWDWTELQEQALRQQRERDRNRLSWAETEALYDEEIATLKDQIGQLKVQIETQEADKDAEVDGILLLQSISQRVGPEIYPGEFLDRLRLAAKTTCLRAEQDGLDARSKAVLERFAEISASPGLVELQEDLRAATKDANRIAGQVIGLLSRHGYHEKAHNKHIRLEPHPGFEGLSAITVPTTPSESRGLTNMRKDIERALGLTKLGV